MTEQEGFDGIIEKLRATAKESCENQEFLAMYETINGFGLDSYKAPMGLALGKEQIIAGGFLIAAYMSFSCKEGPDGRLCRFWKPFIETKSGQIVGLQMQAGQALQYISRIMQNQSMFWSLAGKTGNKIHDKMQAVQTWMMMWIGSSFLPGGTPEASGKLGMLCLGAFLRFYWYFEEVMDKMYGAYVPPPPPPPKKGFWGSLFG